MINKLMLEFYAHLVNNILNYWELNSRACFVTKAIMILLYRSIAEWRIYEDFNQRQICPAYDVGACL